MKIFWGANMDGWRIYGIWIAKRYFFGFSIINEPGGE